MAYYRGMINREEKTMNKPRAMEIGHDYAAMFDLERKGIKMVYNGGISWTCTMPDGRSQTSDAPKQTEDIRTKLATGDYFTTTR